MLTSVEHKIAEFFSQFPVVTYEKGQIILQPGDKMNFIYNIKTGYIKSYSVNEGGFNLIINIYKPYSFFPITETLAEKSNPYYFETVTDTVLQKAPVEKVYEFLKNDSEVLFNLTKRISTGLEGFMIRTQYLIRSNSTQKIASTLVLFSRRFGKELSNNKIQILLPQTHSDIANYSGCSRETASIELKKFEDMSVISISKKIITVNDFEKLKEMSTIYYEDEPLPYSY